MIHLRGTKIADSHNSDTKLYKSLGSLIHDYRKCYKLSQEKISELIGISVRQLRNWETDRRRARLENLHDLSEFTGIPMQVCVALNSDQPIWYSLQKRRFAYSSIETQSYSDELYKFHEELGDKFIVKAERISKDKHISMILSYHQEVYHTIKPLRKNVVEAAATILPDLNHIIFDSWGHYVGHMIFLPLSLDVYEKLKIQKDLESYLSREKISDIVALNEGAFLNYSSFAASINASHQNIISVAQYFTKIKQKERYMVSGYSPVEEAHELFKKNGMRLIRDYKSTGSKIYCKLYEAKLDAVMRPKQPLWNLLSTIEQHDPSLIVDNPYLIVDKEGLGVQNGETQLIESKPEACPNPECILYGIIQKGNIVSNGTYRTQGRAIGRRFLCKTCGKSFCDRTGTLFYDLRLPEEKVLKSLKLLLKGMPLQSVAESLGITFHTVRRWLGIATLQSEKIDSVLIKECNVSSSELAVLWTFVKKNALRQRAALYNRNNENGCRR